MKEAEGPELHNCTPEYSIEKMPMAQDWEQQNSLHALRLGSKQNHCSETVVREDRDEAGLCGLVTRLDEIMEDTVGICRNR